MSWNHRSRVVAMASAIQATPGTFVQPSSATDLIAIANPTNTIDAITADDPTASGTVWESNRAYLGKRATVGCSLPLRGPGGAAPPAAANAWVPGRLFQAAGWAEIRNAAARTAAFQAGSTTTALVLANTESATDDFLLGAPIQTANIGTGFRATSIIRDYNGTTKTADLAETLGAAPAAAVNYTIPMYLSYVLGTLGTKPPLLSISIWRDLKRYDYRDWAPTSHAIAVPVANDANTGFPDITVSGSAIPQALVDEASPVLPSSILNIPLPPARAGKFYIDRVKMGHQSLTFTQTMTVAAQSNQNQDAGQDAYDLVSGSRQIALDLDQMNVSDFDLSAREDAQTNLPLMATWGLGAGNRFGIVIPSVCLDPFSPGDRNGYVNLTGNAYSTDVDKSAALTIWWT